MKKVSGMWLWLGNLEFGQVGYYLVVLLLIVWVVVYLGWYCKMYKLEEQNWKMLFGKLRLSGVFWKFVKYFKVRGIKIVMIILIFFLLYLN